MKKAQKKVIELLLLIIVIAPVATLTNCGSAEGTLPEPATNNLLVNTWAVASVQLDNEDITTEWSGFKLTVDANMQYTTPFISDDKKLVWPTFGSYSYPNSANENLLMRNDGVEITLTNLSVSSVQLTFTIATPSGGRVKGLVGNYVFNLTH